MLGICREESNGRPQNRKAKEAVAKERLEFGFKSQIWDAHCMDDSWRHKHNDSNNDEYQTER